MDTMTIVLGLAAIILTIAAIVIVITLISRNANKKEVEEVDYGKNVSTFGNPYGAQSPYQNMYTQSGVKKKEPVLQNGFQNSQGNYVQGQQPVGNSNKQFYGNQQGQMQGQQAPVYQSPQAYEAGGLRQMSDPRNVGNNNFIDLDAINLERNQPKEHAETTLLGIQEEEGTTILSQNEQPFGVLIQLIDSQNANNVLSYRCAPSVVIGRNANRSQLIIQNDNAVSGRHCMFSYEGGKVFLEDLKSSNGTFLNENRVQQKVECKKGDILTIGRKKYIVQYE